MTQLAQALVLGLVQGGIYSLIALGLVLTYRGSRVLNFAQAEIGAACLYIASMLTDSHLSYWLAAAAAIAAAIGIGLLFELLVVRRMYNASRLAVAVGTIGLFALLVSLEVYFFGPVPHHLPPPVTGAGLQIVGVYVSPTQLLSFVVIGVIAAALALFLRYTDFGLGVSAVAQDATAARLVGIPQRRISMFIWGIGAALSAVAALLIEPTITTIAPNEIGPPLFVGGMAAALVGGLTSLPGAFIGGLLVGVVQAEAQSFLPHDIAGMRFIVLFVIVMLVLLLRPQGIMGKVVARAEAL